MRPSIHFLSVIIYMSSSRVGPEYLPVLLPIQGAALAVSKATMTCGTANVANGIRLKYFCV